MARISKPHTEEKLKLLRKYLDGYVIATTRAKERYYIDALAGDGQCEIRISGSSKSRIIDGSPLIVMKTDPAFTKCFFIEIDKDKVEALSKLLKDFPENRYKIKEGDCNSVIDEILSEIPQEAPCFAFLDPEGFELDWLTIQKIANYKLGRKIELFILFPYNMAFARVLYYNRKRFEKENIKLLLSKKFPDNSWIDVYEERVKGRLRPLEVRMRLLKIFTNGLKRLEYKFVDNRLIKSTKGRPLYYMIFATDHPIGAKIMKHVLKKDWIGGQISFFDKLN
ncbi:MAG: three-Cys-motif partner protein TcmP [candidate division Zixibacteria bacterium]|nr:three-Cys-motif partner protein TcmP [candidate division Zixibacteria bacterium]